MGYFRSSGYTEYEHTQTASATGALASMLTRTRTRAHTHAHTGKQTHTHTHRQTDTHTHTQANRQTDCQTASQAHTLMQPDPHPHRSTVLQQVGNRGCMCMTDAYVELLVIGFSAQRYIYLMRCTRIHTHTRENMLPSQPSLASHAHKDSPVHLFEFLLCTRAYRPHTHTHTHTHTRRHIPANSACSDKRTLVHYNTASHDSSEDKTIFGSLTYRNK